MSKHTGRRQRWMRHDARMYSCAFGKVAYQQDGWYSLLDYKIRLPSEREAGLPSWQMHSQRLGPFKRSRNAMIALEREMTFLKNRHGADILFGDQLWAGA